VGGYLLLWFIVAGALPANLAPMEQACWKTSLLACGFAALWLGFGLLETGLLPGCIPTPAALAFGAILRALVPAVAVLPAANLSADELVGVYSLVLVSSMLLSLTLSQA
jgi:hypothetical protein